MIYPWMFDDGPGAGTAARGGATCWRNASEWPDLYDPDRLARNEVPVAAAVYHDDMYVDTADSLRHRPARSGACAPGSPTSTSTTGSG